MGVFIPQSLSQRIWCSKCSRRGFNIQLGHSSWRGGSGGDQEIATLNLPSLPNLILYIGNGFRQTVEGISIILSAFRGS